MLNNKLIEEVEQEMAQEEQEEKENDQPPQTDYYKEIYEEQIALQNKQKIEQAVDDAVSETLHKLSMDRQPLTTPATNTNGEHLFSPVHMMNNRRQTYAGRPPNRPVEDRRLSAPLQTYVTTNKNLDIAISLDTLGAEVSSKFKNVCQTFF